MSLKLAACVPSCGSNAYQLWVCCHVICMCQYRVTYKWYPCEQRSCRCKTISQELSFQRAYICPVVRRYLSILWDTGGHASTGKRSKHAWINTWYLQRMPACVYCCIIVNLDIAFFRWDDVPQRFHYTITHYVPATCVKKVIRYYNYQVQARMIGFIMLQQNAPSLMTWQDSNTSRKH
jgi:hypothetical protein